MINFIKTNYHNIKIEILSSPNLLFEPTFIDEEEKKKFNLLQKNQFLLLKNQLNENIILKANSLISKKIFIADIDIRGVLPANYAEF